MTQDIKSLLDKIQQEGIQVAEDNARVIEAGARKNAEKIIASAKQEALRLAQEAKDSLTRAQQAQQSLLQQAGRDVILGVRKELEDMLGRLIAQEIRASLTPQVMARIIEELVRSQIKTQGEVIVSVNKEDARALEQGFLEKLSQAAKRGVTLRPSEEILGGFTISFDEGKSQFDFTDKALAEYISTYLKPTLAKILGDV